MLNVKWGLICDPLRFMVSVLHHVVHHFVFLEIYLSFNKLQRQYSWDSRSVSIVKIFFYF